MSEFDAVYRRLDALRAQIATIQTAPGLSLPSQPAEAFTQGAAGMRRYLLETLDQALQTVKAERDLAADLVVEPTLAEQLRTLVGQPVVVYFTGGSSEGTLLGVGRDYLLLAPLRDYIPFSAIRRVLLPPKERPPGV